MLEEIENMSHVITNIFLILDLAEKMENVTLNITSLSSVNPTDPIMLDDPLIQPGIFRKFIGPKKYLTPSFHQIVFTISNLFTKNSRNLTMIFTNKSTHNFFYPKNLDIEIYSKGKTLFIHLI